MKFKKLVGLFTATAVLLSGCTMLSSAKPLSITDTAFDTVISIQVYDAVDKEILERCKAMCEEYEAKFSRTIETSEISQINAAGGAPVAVSPDTIELLKKGIYYGELSNGAFDITIGTVSKLWDFKAETPSVPSPEAISEAINHVDYKNVEIIDNTVTLKDPKASIDLGAIAKGYVADRLKDYLRKEGVKHALINLGGNVQALGKKPDGTPFNIGIPEPFADESTPLTSVKINSKSIVTSGTYQRYFKADDKIYHHILNPNTGYPTDNKLNSISIITDSSLTADALSTTCFVLGPEKAMKLVNQLDNVDAVFVDSQNKITYSQNFQK